MFHVFSKAMVSPQKCAQHHLIKAFFIIVPKAYSKWTHGLRRLTIYLTKQSTILIYRQPNLAKYFYGWSPLWLYHKINQEKTLVLKWLTQDRIVHRRSLPYHQSNTSLNLCVICVLHFEWFKMLRESYFKSFQKSSLKCKGKGVIKKITRRKICFPIYKTWFFFFSLLFWTPPTFKAFNFHICCSFWMI